MGLRFRGRNVRSGRNIELNRDGTLNVKYVIVGRT